MIIRIYIILFFLTNYDIYYGKCYFSRKIASKNFQDTAVKF